jgi:hypothetical protein
VREIAKPDHVEKTKILGNSIKKLIMQNYPGDLGKEMVKCLKQSLKKPKNKQTQDFINCVRMKFPSATVISDQTMTDIVNKLDPLDHYETIG